jgi:predicted transcriptional regulator of viral defense system
VGEVKYVEKFLEYFAGFPAFTSNDVKLFLDKNGAGEGYYRIFMHNLVASGRAFQIKKGHYTLHDDLMAAGFAFSPFYYGMETALTHYDLWDYMTPVSIITAKHVRSGMRTVFGRNVSVRRISEKMLFGYSMVKYEDLFYVPMADIEKTLIDSVYFRAAFNEDVYKRIFEKADLKKVDKYLAACPEEVKSRVRALVAKYGVVTSKTLASEASPIPRLRSA